MNDDHLRAAYRAHIASRAPLDRTSCPTAERLETLARGAAGGDDRLSDLDHVFGCARCLPEFELLRAVESSEAVTARSTSTTLTAASKTPTRTPSTRLRAIVPRSAPRFALAAMLVLSIGLAGDYWRRSRMVSAGNTEPGVVRGDDSGVTLIAPGLATLSSRAEADASLSWHAVDGAESYVADVLDTSGVSLLSRTTTDTVLRLDRDELQRLQNAGIFDWMVSARRMDGNERRSTVTRVRLPDRRR